jgi:L-aspartate oxidase
MAEQPVIVVGSGVAGLWTALKAAPAPVLLLSAGAPDQASSTGWAQGGIAAALGLDDSPARHAADTVIAGDGLVDAAVAAAVAREVIPQVEALERLGMPFERLPGGRWSLAREAAHDRARVAHVGGDRAGLALLRTLLNAAAEADHIEFRPHSPVVGLIHDGHGGCAGVRVREADGRKTRLTGRATVLATGGVGGLYALTTNPAGHRGQALAWAARLGATIRDAEFVQFHPTAIDIGRDPAPLATEALRGAGAVLVDRAGCRFMVDQHPDAELAPRDIVARAVHRQLRTGEGAWLDARGALGAAFPERFAAVFGACMSAGIDPRREPIPVAPAAHYHMGGVASDLSGRTGIDRLYVVGEAACTGLHGANRLASNSLAEALVMGARCGKTLAGVAVHRARRVEPAGGSDATLPDAEFGELRRAMTPRAGVERDAAGLGELLDLLETLERRWGGSDPLVVARLVATAALARRSSRGAHMRSDDPRTPKRDRVASSGTTNRDRPAMTA